MRPLVIPHLRFNAADALSRRTRLNTVNARSSDGIQRLGGLGYMMPKPLFAGAALTLAPHLVTRRSQDRNDTGVLVAGATGRGCSLDCPHCARATISIVQRQI